MKIRRDALRRLVFKENFSASSRRSKTFRRVRIAFGALGCSLPRSNTFWRDVRTVSMAANAECEIQYNMTVAVCGFFMAVYGHQFVPPAELEIESGARARERESEPAVSLTGKKDGDQSRAVG